MTSRWCPALVCCAVLLSAGTVDAHPASTDDELELDEVRPAKPAARTRPVRRLYHDVIREETVALFAQTSLVAMVPFGILGLGGIVAPVVLVNTPSLCACAGPFSAFVIGATAVPYVIARVVAPWLARPPASDWMSRRLLPSPLLFNLVDVVAHLLALQVLLYVANLVLMETMLVTLVVLAVGSGSLTPTAWTGVASAGLFFGGLLGALAASWAAIALIPPLLVTTHAVVAAVVVAASARLGPRALVGPSAVGELDLSRLLAEDRSPPPTPEPRDDVE